MGAVHSSDPCTICFRKEVVMNSHHTVPQCRGGQNSLQIILCPTCHDNLHGNAVAIVARIRNPKSKKSIKQFWKDANDIERAQPYLEILVRALLTPLPAGFERDHTLTTSVTTTVFEQIKTLQVDLDKSSMDKTLEYCIAYTLHSKGIQNATREQKERTSMWFMPISGS